MASVGCLLLLGCLIGLVTLQAEAFTEEENLIFVESVLKLLNNKEECLLPTYQEVDELQKSFVELEQIYGAELESRLTPDQKLLRETLLDQWESFSKKMTDGVVIRSAKKRAFICKIESYQTPKHGFSICTKIKDTRAASSDHIFEKNPLVRYIKHIDEMEVEEQPVEPPVELVLTPIVTTNHTEPAQSAESTQSAETITKPEEVIVEDPLADVPVPAAQQPEDQDASPASLEPQPDSFESVEATDSNEPQPEADTTTNSNNSEVESVEVESQQEPASGSDDAQGEPDKQQAEDEPETQIESPEAASEQQTEAPIQQVKNDHSEPEVLDDADDDEDLNRLNQVVPLGLDFELTYGPFGWPDESKQGEIDHDDSIKNEWMSFLESASSGEAVVYDKPAESGSDGSVVQSKVDQAQRLKDLRRRKQEYLKSINRDVKVHQSSALFGWRKDRYVAPKKDRWLHVADNNLYKISLNRDYLAQTRASSAMKSMFNGNSGVSKKKKQLMKGYN